MHFASSLLCSHYDGSIFTSKKSKNNLVVRDLQLAILLLAFNTKYTLYSKNRPKFFERGLLSAI